MATTPIDIDDVTAGMTIRITTTRKLPTRSFTETQTITVDRVTPFPATLGINTFGWRVCHYQANGSDAFLTLEPGKTKVARVRAEEEI